MAYFAATSCNAVTSNGEIRPADASSAGVLSVRGGVKFMPLASVKPGFVSTPKAPEQAFLPCVSFRLLIFPFVKFRGFGDLTGMNRALPSEKAKSADQAAAFLRDMQSLHQAVLRELAPVLEEYDIDPRLFSLLKQIERGVVHPGAISKAIHLPNSVVTRHIDQLADRGLLERSLDTEDSRRIKLTLTKEGLRVARETTRTVCNVISARLERIPASRRDVFLAAFSDLARDR